MRRQQIVDPDQIITDPAAAASAVEWMQKAEKFQENYLLASLAGNTVILIDRLDNTTYNQAVMLPTDDL